MEFFFILHQKENFCFWSIFDQFKRSHSAHRNAWLFGSRIVSSSRRDSNVSLRKIDDVLNAQDRAGAEAWLVPLLVIVQRGKGFEQKAGYVMAPVRCRSEVKLRGHESHKPKPLDLSSMTVSQIR
jgi:hypothetical protein